MTTITGGGPHEYAADVACHECGKTIGATGYRLTQTTLAKSGKELETVWMKDFCSGQCAAEFERRRLGALSVN